MFKTPINLGQSACVNYRHPGPLRVWDGGSEPPVLTPFPSSGRFPSRIPKMQKLCAGWGLQSSRGFPKQARLLMGPQRGQWDPLGSKWSPIVNQFDPIWIQFEPNRAKLGTNRAQYVFTNSRSTAQRTLCYPHPPPYTQYAT